MQHFLAFIFAFGLDAMAEDKFRSGLVHARVVTEAHAVGGTLDRPSSENLRDFGHIPLRVAAIHTHGVQLEQLASVIFVQAAILAARPGIGIGARKTGTTIRTITDWA